MDVCAVGDAAIPPLQPHTDANTAARTPRTRRIIGPDSEPYLACIACLAYLSPRLMYEH